GFERLGQAEVHDLGGPVVRQQDVRRLEVAVDDPQAVGLADGAGQDRDQPRRGFGRPGGTVEPPREAAPSRYSISNSARPSGVPVWAVGVCVLGWGGRGNAVAAGREAGPAPGGGMVGGGVAVRAQAALARDWAALAAPPRPAAAHLGAGPEARNPGDGVSRLS